MDRNREQFKYVVQCRVALRKESVDRNNIGLASSRASITSLSARRAWIEIIMFVNLRVLDGSLSARRAWIEMMLNA